MRKVDELNLRIHSDVWGWKPSKLLHSHGNFSCKTLVDLKYLCDMLKRVSVGTHIFVQADVTICTKKMCIYVETF